MKITRSGTLFEQVGNMDFLAKDMENESWQAKRVIYLFIQVGTHSLRKACTDSV